MEKENMLTARSHAYLFGVIARETIDTFGEIGEQAIAKGVVLYGQQRGRRMAMRAAADELESSALNYVLYGEWSSAPSEMDFSILSKNPDIQYWIKKCPWHDVWFEQGQLEQYGYLYCKYIDIAIAQGYNQRLKFDVLKNRGLGDDVCDMRLRNAHVTGADEVEFALRIERLGNKAKMPWDYHCAHLFKTLWEVVVSTFGFGGMESMQKALQAFGKVYGRKTGDDILKLMDTDFNVIPPYEGLNLRG